MTSRLLTAILTLAVAFVATAQRFDWSISLNTVFDNREGDRQNIAPETVFFTKLTPEIGFSLGKGDRVAGGIVWIQPIGYDWNGNNVRPTTYYHHKGSHLSGALGLFPRTLLAEEMPSFMWCDSLVYFQDNIRGALLQWHAGRSFAEAYLDWRQRQTESKRESFSIVAHARWQHGSRPWMAGAYVSMNHLALTKNAPTDMHIVDNFLAAPYIGADLAALVPFDRLRIRLGFAATIERNRADRIWKTQPGAWLEVLAAWKGFEIKNMTYAGARLQPSYGLFGAMLYQGEPFYKQRFYNRTDISYGIIRRRSVDLRAELNFNITPGSFIFYQKLSLRIFFGNSHDIKRKSQESSE